MITARKIILKHYFEGLPHLHNFLLVEEKLSGILDEGEILISAKYFSIDPFTRTFGTRNRANIGDTINGVQIAEVLKSKHANFPEGSKVIAGVGWRDYTIVSPDNMKTFLSFVLPFPEIGNLPETYALGACGFSGLAALFGFTKICEPKKGDVVVVNSAAGAVGSIVTQIAKMKGCKVLAFAGSDEKVKWLKEELKIKFAFNYKDISSVDSILKKYAVEGVDCYFDNVGGEFTFNVLKNMNANGKCALCGAVSQYNNDVNLDNKVPFDYVGLIHKQIRMEGFLVSKWMGEFDCGIKQLVSWIQEKKLIVRETPTKGFDKIPQAFVDVFDGKNIGKAFVVV